MSNSVSEATIKFLVRDEAVSTLLGKGGDTIKHMKEYTGCNVSVSARKEFYPGTSFRVVVIEGNQADVERAVVCMWQLFFSIAKARQNKEKIADLVWTADSNVDMNQYIADKPMEGYLAIPENAGGFIIGKNGSTLEELKRRSGATLFISKQQDSYFSRERTITIQGNTASICCIASIAIVRKLVEGDGTQSYVSYRNRGTRYTIGAILPKDQYTKLPRDDEPVQNDFPVIKKSFEVSNSEVGSVIGENGANSRAIVAICGIDELRTPKNADDSNNRTVTVIGKSVNVQNAIALCRGKISFDNKAKARPKRL